MPPRVWNVTPSTSPTTSTSTSTSTSSTSTTTTTTSTNPSSSVSTQQQPSTSTSTTSSRRVLSSIGDKLTAATSRPRSVFIRAFNGKDGSGASFGDDDNNNNNNDSTSLSSNNSTAASALPVFVLAGVGVTRDRSEEFFAVRRNDVKLVMDAREIDRVFNLYTMASFNKTSGSNAKSARLGAISLLTDGQSDAKQCSKCGKAFGKLFGKRHNCNVCSMAVCDNCYSFTVPVVGALNKGNAAAVLKVCEDCHRMIHKYERRKQFRNLADQITKHPFSVYHATIAEVTAEIRALMPEFQQLSQRVLSLPEDARAYADVVRIKKLCDELQPLMSDFEHGLNVVAKLPVKTDADQKLARNVRQSLVSLAQLWLPPWRMLSQQARHMPMPLDPVVAAAIERERVAEKEKIAAALAKVPPPEILSIVPALSALDGSRVLVQGDNFSVGIQVEVGGKPVPSHHVELRDVHHLLVLTPKFADEGIRSIAVITANGHRHEQRDAVLYTRAFDGNSAAAIEQALKNETEDGDDAILAAAAAAAEAAAEAAEIASRELTIASVDPSFTPLAGAPIVVRLENGAIAGLQVKIAGRVVYNSATKLPNGDIRVECQAPRVDTEGFQPIEIKLPDGRRCVYDNLMYAKVAATVATPGKSPVKAAQTTATTKRAAAPAVAINMDELDDIDKFLDSMPS